MPWFFALLLLILSSSPAFAAIKFCNNFDHPVFFAVAYQTQEGWISEGWLKVDPKACLADDKHAEVTSFYWRGETDWIKVSGGRSKWSWGKGGNFSIKDSDFAFKNADQKLKGARLESFSGPISLGSPEALVTVTIDDAQHSTTSLVDPTNALKSDPDYKTCKDESGDIALSACERALNSGNFTGALLADLHIFRGFEREQKKDVEGALADYEEAIRIDPNNSVAHVDRANLRSAKKDYDGALQDLDIAIKIDPKYVRAYIDRADIWDDKDEYDRAIADYQAALALDPNDKQKARIEHNLAIAYIDRGVQQKDENAELADYNAGLKLDPNNVTGLNNRGAVYNQMGEYDKALEDLNLAIKLKPDYARAYRNRGDSYKGKDNLDLAIADYKQALSLNPPDALKQAIQKALAEVEELQQGAEPEAPQDAGAKPASPASEPQKSQP